MNQSQFQSLIDSAKSAFVAHFLAMEQNAAMSATAPFILVYTGKHGKSWTDQVDGNADSLLTRPRADYQSWLPLTDANTEAWLLAQMANDIESVLPTRALHYRQRYRQQMQLPKSPLSPCATSQPSADDGALIGGLVGGLVALLAIGGLAAVVVMRRRRRAKANRHNGDVRPPSAKSEIPSSPPSSTSTDRLITMVIFQQTSGAQRVIITVR
jgi:hypothetical protein